MDYLYHFLIAALATTVGVFFALFLQRWRDNTMRLKEAESIKSNLITELEDIKKIIINIHAMKDVKHVLSPIKMPRFHGLVGSTKISLLYKFGWYNDLLDLYQYFDAYNSWHNLRTYKFFYDSMEESSIDDSLKKIEIIVLGTSIISDSSHSQNNACLHSKCISDESKSTHGLISYVIAKMSLDSK